MTDTKVKAVVELLASGASVEHAGKRTLLLAHLLGVGGPRTQRELAHLLGVTPSRVSSAIKFLHQNLQQLLSDRDRAG